MPKKIMSYDLNSMDDPPSYLGFSRDSFLVYVNPEGSAWSFPYIADWQHDQACFIDVMTNKPITSETITHWFPIPPHVLAE